MIFSQGAWRRRLVLIAAAVLSLAALLSLASLALAPLLKSQIESRASAALGRLWNIEFPVIKKIWTSSYVLVAGGYSAMLLGAFYWIVDVQKKQTWCQPFIWIGMNPITLYLTSNFFGGLGYGKLATRVAGGPVKAFLDTHIAHGFGDLAIALLAVLIFIWYARFLYQRKIFLRL